MRIGIGVSKEELKATPVTKDTNFSFGSLILTTEQLKKLSILDKIKYYLFTKDFHYKKIPVIKTILLLNLIKDIILLFI